MLTWHEFERTAAKPAERLAKRIVREVARCEVPGEQRTPCSFDTSTELRDLIRANLDAFLVAWKVGRDRLLPAIDMPDAKLAELYLGTLRSMRDKQEIDPELDPKWMAARAKLLACVNGRWARKPLSAAVKSTDAHWIVFAKDGEAIGYVERSRITREVARVPPDATWTVSTHSVDPDNAWWVCSWRGGRGGLRMRLQPLPTRVADRMTCVWVHLDATGVQSMHTQDAQAPATPAHQACEEHAKETETPMAKKTNTKAEAPQSDPKSEAAFDGDVFAELDRRQLNISGFGTNGRKTALCVLYTRTKPSRKVAQAKGATLAEAFNACLSQIDTSADQPADEQDTF